MPADLWRRGPRGAERRVRGTRRSAPLPAGGVRASAHRLVVALASPEAATSRSSRDRGPLGAASRMGETWVADYLERIGAPHVEHADLDHVPELHRRHLLTVPFE